MHSLLVTGALGLSTLAPQIAPAANANVRSERAVFAAMNGARARAGLRPLRPLNALVRPAREQSTYLLGLGRLEHDGPDGAPFWDRLVKAGFRSSPTMAENLAMAEGCPQTASVIVDMWLRSPLHRANLLSPRYRWVGVGIATTGDCGTTYYTTEFGG